jgi:hypothetical protein
MEALLAEAIAGSEGSQDVQVLAADPLYSALADGDGDGEMIAKGVQDGGGESPLDSSGQEQTPGQEFDLLTENARLQKQLTDLMGILSAQGIQIPNQQQQAQQAEGHLRQQQTQTQLTIDDYNAAMESPEGFRTFMEKYRTQIEEGVLLRTNKAVQDEVKSLNYNKSIWEGFFANKANEDLAPFQRLIAQEVQHVGALNPNMAPPELLKKAAENFRGSLHKALAARGKDQANQATPGQRPKVVPMPSRSSGVRPTPGTNKNPQQALLDAMFTSQ